MQVHDLHLCIRMLNIAKESIIFEKAKKKDGNICANMNYKIASCLFFVTSAISREVIPF